jgi:hypothetical protein
MGLSKLIAIRNCALFVGVLLLATTGCSSSSPGTITGKVTYNGQPVKGGSVSFISTEDHPSGSSAIAADGTYNIASMPSGNVIITVDTESFNPKKNIRRTSVPKYGPPKDQKLPEGYNTSAGGGAMSAKEMEARYVKIPEKYADQKSSGLNYTVTSGDQTHNIDLK